MQDRPLFRDVDLAAFEHGRDLGGDAGVFGRRHQQLTGFGRQGVFRVVEQQAAGFDGERCTAFRVPGEQVEDAYIA